MQKQPSLTFPTLIIPPLRQIVLSAKLVQKSSISQLKPRYPTKHLHPQSSAAKVPVIFAPF